jgi:hypothetical protein
MARPESIMSYTEITYKKNKITTNLVTVQSEYADDKKKKKKGRTSNTP